MERIDDGGDDEGNNDDAVFGDDYNGGKSNGDAYDVINVALSREVIFKNWLTVHINVSTLYVDIYLILSKSLPVSLHL